MSPKRAKKTVAEVGAFLSSVSPDDPANGHVGAATAEPPAYIECLAEFLAEADPPEHWVFPDLLPRDVIMLIHGEPRARKSLVAFELALSAATGTAPFGLARFQPAAPIGVLYIQEEDHRTLTKKRVRRLVHERCGARLPDTMHVSIRRGIDLDDRAWVARITDDVKRLGIRFLVLDAARRLSIKTDEGPAKVRELIAVLRAIVTQTGVTIAIVHHDTKPPATGQDQRRRSQRASGGDWFAACECPVHVERVSESQSLVYPQDYKFAVDPAPFTFTCALDGPLIRALVGASTTRESADTAGERGRLIAWLETHDPASKTAMKRAGFGWEALGRHIPALDRAGLIASIPGRTKKSVLFFVVKPPVSEAQDGSVPGAFNAL